MTCCLSCVILVWSTANRTLVECIAASSASRCNNCVSIFVGSLWYSFCNCRIALCASLYSSTLWCASRLFCYNRISEAVTCCFCCVVLVWSTANRTLVECVAVSSASRCNNCGCVAVGKLCNCFCYCCSALCASLCFCTFCCASRLFYDNSTAICVARASAGEFVCLCYRRIVCRINFYSEWTAVFECDTSDIISIVFKLIYTYHTAIRKFNCVVCIVIKPEINAVAHTELSFAQYAWKGRIRKVCAPINGGRGRNCELIHITARLAGLCYSAVSFWCVLCFVVMTCFDVNRLYIVKIWKVQGVEGHVIFIVNIPNCSAVFDNRLAIWKASIKGVYTAVYCAVSV